MKSIIEQMAEIKAQLESMRGILDQLIALDDKKLMGVKDPEFNLTKQMEEFKAAQIKNQQITSADVEKALRRSFERALESKPKKQIPAITWREIMTQATTQAMTTSVEPTITPKPVKKEPMKKPVFMVFDTQAEADAFFKGYNMPKDGRTILVTIRGGKQ